MPKYLLMDEPTGNVDTSTRDELMKLVKDLNEKHRITVIMITHDPNVAEYAHKTVYIIDGKIYESEEEFKQKIEGGL